MTKTADTTTLEEATDHLTTVTAALEEAQRLVALGRAIADAPATAKRLLAEVAAAQEALAQRSADLMAAERAARFKGIRDIRIETERCGNDSALSNRYTAIYIRDTYDPSIRKSYPQEHRANGIFALPDEVYQYLIEVRPEAIPSEIMALDPTSAAHALKAYFVALRRGYMTVVK